MVEPATLPEIPGYRLLARLGRGGMGEVYLADDLGLGRRVALKRIAAEPHGQEPRERFRREAQTMAQVSHPHIVQIHKRGEHEGHDFLVMELVEGGTLADRIGTRGPLPVPEALAILRQIGEGLAAAWQRGIVHRDVKPPNILFDCDGNAKVADFGLAKAVVGRGSLQVTEPGVVLGTPYYLSPEQAGEGEVSFASDVYSLGIVLYEMLVGSPPCAGDSYFKVIHRHLEGKLPDLAAAGPGIPAGVAELYRWMTRRDPASRPRSYADLLATIDRLQSSSALSATRLGSGPAWRARGARWAVRAALTAMALAGGLTLAWRWNGRPPSRSIAAPSIRPSPSPAPVVPPSPPSAPPPTVPPPEDARELITFRTGRFGLELETSPGPPLRFTAQTGRTAYLTLFTLGGPGDLILLHPTGPETGEPLTPDRPLPVEVAVGAPTWVFVVATARSLTPPILLGARPEGRAVVYPHSIEGRVVAFPARDYLRWLTAKLRDAGTDCDVLARPLTAIAHSEERRAP
jgi:serine/threonine protein kinase